MIESVDELKGRIHEMANIGDIGQLTLRAHRDFRTGAGFPG